MLNFKTETEEILDKKFSDTIIDQWLFIKDSETVKGTGPIDWDLVKKTLPFENEFEYDEGFGADDITGFITFKNKDSWLMRYEHDGSSWWKYITRPSF